MTGRLRDDKVLKEAFELKKKKNETKMTKVREETQHHTASTDVSVCVCVRFARQMACRRRLAIQKPPQQAAL